MFALAVITILMTPGPTNTLLATSGATVGISRSMPLLLSEIGGYSTAIILIHFMLAPLMNQSSSIQALLRITAGLYLFYLAVRVWRSRLERRDRVILPCQLLVTTLLNPKAAIFALIVIPFDSSNVTWYLMALLALLPLIGTGWLALGALLGRGTDFQYPQAFAKGASIVMVIFSTTLICTAIASIGAP